MPRRALTSLMGFFGAVFCICAGAESTPERSAFLERLVGDVRPSFDRPQYCLTSGADTEASEYVERVLALSAPVERFSGSDSVRWKQTATNGAGIVRGQPITLTWSIVPDGLRLESTAASASNLKSKFDETFGSRAAWVGLLTEVFDEWSTKTGITFVKVGDDGDLFPSKAGVLGRRGDIRIGGFNIDGSGAGVLAYNYYPNGGDMVLDTANAGDIFSTPQFNYRLLRNVVSHELGHGLGFDHVCPQDETKIMEAFITRAIDHSAPDDIANGNRKYGDPYEKGSRNDTAGTATALGVIGSIDVGDGADVNRRIASLDAATDIDFYSVTLTAGTTVSAWVVPTGGAYAFADDTGSGCNGKPLSVLASSAMVDLSIQLIAPDGVTVVAQADSREAGLDEFLLAGPVPSNGAYFVRVYTNDAVALPADDQIQLYELSIRAPGEDLSEIPVSSPRGRMILLTVLGCLGAKQVLGRRRLGS